MSKNAGKRKVPANQANGGKSKSKKGPPAPQLFQPEIPNDLNTPLFATREQAELYASFRNRGIYSTKFYHRPTMESLGLHTGVNSLFEHVGWEGFLTLEAKTYAVPTKEFLATLEVDDETRQLSFRLRSQPHTITYDRLNSMMHTPTEGYIEISNPATLDTIIPDHWSVITIKDNYEPRREKSTSIVHPCWRVAHRMASACLLAKKESSQVNCTELFFLWNMAQPNPYRPDFATFFLDRVFKTLDQPDGEICFGGFVTIIGQELGLSFDNEPAIDEYHRLDLAALKRMYMVKKGSGAHAGTHSWLYHEKKPLYILPSPHISSFDRANPLTWMPPLDFTLPPEYKHARLTEPVVEPPVQEEPQVEQQQFQMPPQLLDDLCARISTTLQAQFEPRFQQLHTRIEEVVETVRNIPTRSDWEYQRVHGHFPSPQPRTYRRRGPPPPDQPPPGGYPPYLPPPGGASN